MNMMKKSNQDAWLWWVSVISLSIGAAVFILLKSSVDYKVAQIRSMAIFISIFISGLCVIIGTRRRWFGKGL